MSWLRTTGFLALVSVVSIACTLTRPLDYLQEGDDAGTDTSSSSSGTTSSSSSGDPLDPDGGPKAGQLLAGQQLNPSSLVQDTDNLYWATEDGRIMKVAKTGGAPKELAKLTAGVDAITGMTVDPSPGGNLFILVDGAVKRLSRDGGAPADFLPGPNFIQIAADDTFLFALSTNDDDIPTFARYPKANAAQPTVLSQPEAVGDTGEGSVALFGDSVYWTTNDADAVQVLYELPKTAATGTAPMVWKNTGRNIDNEVAGIYALESYELAVDADGIYWIDDSYAVPYRMLRSQKMTDAPVLLSAQISCAAIAVDAANIYVLATDRVIKISKADTSQRTPFNVETSATELLTDDKAIYYVFLGDDDLKATGGVYRVPK